MQPAGATRAGQPTNIGRSITPDTLARLEQADPMIHSLKPIARKGTTSPTGQWLTTAGLVLVPE